MSIQANLKEVLSELPAGVRLVAVSKFHPNEALEEAYAEMCIRDRGLYKQALIYFYPPRKVMQETLFHQCNHCLKK